MPSAGRTSKPISGPAPRTSTFEATLRLVGSMVTMDLPSTRPIIQPAWAVVATNAEAASAPASDRTFIFPNIGFAPLEMVRGSSAVTVVVFGIDGGSYGTAAGRDAMAGRIFQFTL